MLFKADLFPKEEYPRPLYCKDCVCCTFCMMKKEVEEKKISIPLPAYAKLILNILLTANKYASMQMFASTIEYKTDCTWRLEYNNI